MSAGKVKRTLRRSAAHRLRYSDKPGTCRLSEVLDASDWQHAVMAAVGSDWGGNHAPPFSKTFRYPWGDTERLFASNNDGMELWFGYPKEWTWHISESEVRLLTRYLLVEWYLKARWLGLRRPIYYFALHSVVTKWKRQRPNGGDR